MRENRPYGSEGGEANTFPTPITPRVGCASTAAFHMVDQQIAAQSVSRSR